MKSAGSIAEATGIMMARTGLGFLLLAALAAGCSTYGPSSTQCNVGADCASGQCRADGTCVPVSTGTGGAGGTTGTSQGGGGTTTTSSTSSTSSSSSSSTTTSGSPSCVPDHDGSITRAESPLGPGLKATFEMADDVTFDTKGTGTNPNRVWKLDGALKGDHQVVVPTLPLDPGDPAAPWFAQDFVDHFKITDFTRYYAAVMADPKPASGHTLEDQVGVFELTATELRLLGIASSVQPTSSAGTEVFYDPPITALAFPLTLGKKWSSQTTSTGTANGYACPYFAVPCTITSDSQVDAAGTVKTPYGDFPVLRVHTQAQAALGWITTTKQTLSFVSECAGTVATIKSETAVFTADFMTCPEIWRLTK